MEEVTRKKLETVIVFDFPTLPESIFARMPRKASEMLCIGRFAAYHDVHF